MLGTGEIGDLARSQLLRQGKLRTSHKPVREVVALGVVDDAFRGNLLEHRFKGAEVGGAAHFRQVGQTKKKSPNPNCSVNDAAQIGKQGGRALAQEGESLGESTFPNWVRLDCSTIGTSGTCFRIRC